MQSFLIQKKTVIIEVAVLILFLGGGYYLYSLFSVQTSVTTKPALNEQLLGQNFVLLIKAVDQDKISFRETAFMDAPEMQQLRDHSETIGVNETRGRVDPFVPYAATRPLR